MNNAINIPESGESPLVSDAGNCRIYYDGSDNGLYASQNGGAYTPLFNGIRRATLTISLAQLKAAGAVATANFNMASALPNNARLLSSEIFVVSALAGAAGAVATVQASGETPGAILAATSLLALGPVTLDGSNPYPSRAGQTLQATVTLTGAVLSALTAGSLAVNFFYSITP